MGFFTKKEQTDEEFNEEMKVLERDIKRLQKKNELLKAKKKLSEEAKKNSGWAELGAKIMKGMGEAGANVKANLDKEAPLKYDDSTITKDLPGVSKGRMFNEQSITSDLPGMRKTPSRSTR